MPTPMIDIARTGREERDPAAAGPTLRGSTSGTGLLHAGQPSSNPGVADAQPDIALSHLRCQKWQAILICMTPVRQDGRAEAGRRTATQHKDARRAAKATGRQGRSAKSAPTRKQAGPRTGGASQVAQVRLQADEMAALHHVMNQLGLSSTSEALREGIRLLIRDATELAAAEEISHFYRDAPAPIPDGVIPATEDDLAAADAAKW